MTGRPRITLRIDRIVCDGPLPDRRALEAALIEAVGAQYSAGSDVWAQSANLAGGQVSLAPGREPAATRVAQAVVRATTGGLR